MLPLVIALWQSDATVRAALEQSAQASLTRVGTGTLLTGGEVSADVQGIAPTAAYALGVRGLYTRALTFSGPGALVFPANNGAGELFGDATFQLAPRVRLVIGTQDYITTRYGIRASDALALADPFFYANRVEYSIGGDASLLAITSPRGALRVSGGYTQQGGLFAAAPGSTTGESPAPGEPSSTTDPIFASTTGVDAHVVRASVAESYDLTRRDRVTPELRYVYTHYYHALGGVPTTQVQTIGPFIFGEADIHAATALFGEAHTFGRRWIGQVTAGVTTATPPPILRSGLVALPPQGLGYVSSSVVVAPELRLAMSYAAPRYRASAGYTYAYASLGPRIGYGLSHSGLAEVSFRPVRGAKYRDLLMAATARATFGAAPVAPTPANPMSMPGGTGLSPTSLSILRTSSVAAGGRVEYPIRRGLVALASVDVQYVNSTYEPTPPAGAPVSQLLTLAVVGVAGTLSTDPSRTVARDPEIEDIDARRRLGGDVFLTDPFIGRALEPRRELERGGRAGDRDMLEGDWQRDPYEEDVRDSDRESSSPSPRSTPPASTPPTPPTPPPASTPPSSPPPTGSPPSSSAPPTPAAPTPGAPSPPSPPPSSAPPAGPPPVPRPAPLPLERVRQPD